MGRVLIFGAGAIGQWLGAALSQAGEEVTLVTRAEACKAINERGLRCGLKTVRLKAFEEAPAGSYDLVVLTVKTFDVAEALDILGSRLSFHQVLTIQNGIGTDELVRKRFLSAGLIVGSVTCSVASPEPGVIHPGLTGGLGLAPYSDAPTVPLQKLFEKGGLKVQLCPDYRSMKWSKLCLNVVGNALGALLDCTPTELFGDRKLYRFEVRSLSEVRKVIRAQNLKIIDLPDYPVKKFSEVMFWLPSRLSFPCCRRRCKEAAATNLPRSCSSCAGGEPRPRSTSSTGPSWTTARGWEFPHRSTRTWCAPIMRPWRIRPPGGSAGEANRTRSWPSFYTSGIWFKQREPRRHAGSSGQ